MTRKVFRLKKFGRRLGTRLEGTQAREEILRELSGLPPGGKLVIDLSGLEVLSGSFADEALVEVAERLRGGEHLGRYLLVKAEDEELLEDLSGRLARRGLAMLALVGEDFQVLGKLPTYLAEALGKVIEQGRLTSPELARALGISVQNASVRLSELAKLRLVHMVQEPRPMGGVQHRAVSLISLNEV